MEEKRVFTEEELRMMGERTLDLLQAAIEAGDKKTAKKLSKRMYNEFLGMHDLYRDWITGLLTFIGKNYGDEVLYEAMKETVGDLSLRLGKRYANKSTREKIEILAAGLRGHLHPIKIEEDDEKFVIHTQPCCGSGGRLVLEGAYDPPGSFLRIKKPQPMTFNRPNFPVYCAHCYVMGTCPTEPGGKALMITDPPEKIGEEPCRCYVYK